MPGFRAAVSPSAGLCQGNNRCRGRWKSASIAVQKERSEKWDRRSSNRSPELRLKPNLARKSYP
jgi:hypothetical protein